MKDALEQDIVFGQKYGFSTSKSGIESVVVGIALRETKSKVRLDVISWTEYMHGCKTKYDSFLPSQTISVQSYHLFPVKD